MQELQLRGRGRPPVLRREDRIDLLVRTAATILRTGAPFTIESVAHAAGMSRKTVYALMQNKEALITEVVLREASTVDLLFSDDPLAEGGWMPQLRQFLCGWVRLAVGPLGLRLYLMAVANRDTAPDIALTLQRDGAEHCAGVLREWFSRPAISASLHIDDMDQALNLLSALLIAQPLRLASLGIASARSDQDIEHDVDKALAIFLRCYARR